MDFTQKKKLPNNHDKYHIENLKITRTFSKKLLTEMNDLVRSIVLFGSNTHDTLKKDSDIDIMVVLDNVSLFVGDELREAYKIITNKLILESSNKIHLLTVNLSDLWDMARKGDPVLINILRYGLPIFDRDLISPMQYLLEIGRIKPSKEAAYNYMARAQTLYDETSKHIEIAILDLYYSVVDIVHSSLIIEKQMPPSPKQMPLMFKQTFKGTPLEKLEKDINDFYKIAKKIEHRNSKILSGKDFDEYKKKAKKIIDTLTKYNSSKIKKLSDF